MRTFYIALFLIVCAIRLNAQNMAIDKNNFDLKTNPGDDFFQYANGGWCIANPIPDDKARYGAMDELSDANQKQIRELLKTIMKQPDIAEGSNEQKLRNFAIAAIDSVKIDNEGINAISGELKRIENIKNTTDLQKELAHFFFYGVSPLFYLYSTQDSKNSDMVIAALYQGGISLPDKDYYLKEDEQSKQIREAYVKHIIKLLQLAEIPKNESIANADLIMKMETQFAKSSNSRLENRDPNKLYNKMSVEELSILAPGFNWKDFFAMIGYSNIKEIDVNQPNYIKEVSKMINEYSVNDWKVFLRYKLISMASPYLSSPLITENFEFFNKFLYGQQAQKPRWKRVLSEANRDIGEIIGQLYVEKYFPADAKTRMIELVGNLKKAFQSRIENVNWLSPETKKLAIEKLQAMNTKIGYPDKWRDYSKLVITSDSYIMNVFRANEFNTKFELDKIGKPVDRNEWGMTPQTVNAYYSPEMNEVVFPAGILQPPFFDMNADDAVNYGAIGSVIGHEMTHGFDDQGCLYDKKGNLKNWWTSKDSAAFVKSTKILKDQFDKMIVIDSTHVNGSLTLGENIADLGGITISYQAFQMTKQYKDSIAIDEFTPSQRFYYSYAQAWRTNIRDKALKRQLQEDVHSPAKCRVNGVLFNINSFYSAFPQINSSGKLYKAPKERVSIW